MATAEPSREPARPRRAKNNSPTQSMAFTQPLATQGQLYADPMVTVF